MADPVNTDPLEAIQLEDGIGLCMSGGGFRAMIFHLGALWRLNELGLLRRIQRFSSVSGGSITNGALAFGWSRLAFDANGSAVNLGEIVGKPLLAFAKQKVDVKAALVGLLPGQSGAHRVSLAYDKALFHGASLQDLPSTPRFVFNTTNLMSGSLLRISADYAADHRIGQIERPHFRLADVVAASSAFPPVLSPLDLKFGDQKMVPWPDAALGGPPYTQRAVLTDGGVYDNLGLETVWKRYRTILVSNAGRNVGAEEQPWHSWPLQLYRVLNVIHNQVDNARERQLIALARAKLRIVAYWAIETEPSGYQVKPALVLSDEERARSAGISTRLSKLSTEDCALLMRHAYLLCDLAVRRFVDPNLPPPAAFPEFGNP
jgi:NTE family protein